MTKLDSMKSFLTALFIAFLAIATFAQENESNEDHMTFKGVPIDGTLEKYVSKMKQSGFSHIGTNAGVAMLKGDFAGYKDCVVGVATLKQLDLVSRVTVIFPENDTWSSLSSNYYQLKELLTEKYGEPSEVVEKFDTYKEPDDDNSKMHEVQFDNCKYTTFFETDKGTIQLSIDHESVISCFVTLSYFDKTNSKLIREKAKGDL